MALYDRVKTNVKDTAGKLADPDDYYGAVAEAIRRYSRVRPRRLCVDVAGNGTHDYALPDGWTPDFSVIDQIEYPVGQVPELYLDMRDYKVVLTPAGLVLRILSATPTAAETMRVQYTAPHAETTLPDNDLDAVANLATSHALHILASCYGQTSDPLIGADVVNYRSKSGEFLKLAKAFEDHFNEHLGLGKEVPVAAASVTASEPDNGPVGLVHLNSRVRMTHGRRS